MHFKPAGLTTKLIIAALMIYMSISLLNLHTQIQSTQSQQADLAEQVARQRQINRQLSEAIENSDDPDTLEAAARDKGYVKPGETIYIDVAN